MAPRLTRVACAVALLAAAAAGAQPGPDLVAIARQEFELAEKEIDLGHFEKALEHLETAYRLTARPALLYNLGYVHEQLFARTRKLDHLRKGIELFQTFLANTKDATDPKVLAQRGRATKELQGAEDALAKELAARAKGEEALGVGEQFLAAGRIAEAREQLDRFVRLPRNERPGVVRALVLRGGIAAAEGDMERALDAFGKALILDRSAALPEGAPALARTAFGQAREAVATVPILTVSHVPSGSIKPGAGVDLAFSSSPDPAGIVRGIQVYYRAGGGAFSSLPFAAIGKLSLPRPFTAALLPGAKIEYYADVVDQDGAILQHLGAVSLPFTVEVERPPPPSIARRWWFWTAAVAVVAAAAGGVGLYSYLSQPQFTELPFHNGLLHF